MFLLEGLFDRQMDSQRVKGAGRLRPAGAPEALVRPDRLGARGYGRLAAKVDPERDYSSLNRLCPYGIDIERKLKVAHGKLSRERYVA